MKKTRIVALVLCAALTVSTLVAPVVPVGAISAETQAKLDAAKKEQEALKASLKNAQKLVTNLNSSKKSAQQKISEYNSMIADLEGQLDVLGNQLEETYNNIGQAKLAVEDAQQTADNQYLDMKKRIQYMYENRTSDLIDMILEAGSIVGMLNAMEYVASLETYDRQMLEKYERTREELEQAKEQLEAEYALLQEQEASVSAQQDSVEVLRKAKNAELTAIGAELNEAQAVAKEYEQEVAAQTEILAQIQAIAKAEEEEENARRLNSGAFAWPCPKYTRISSDYGKRSSPTKGASTDHKGVDMAAPYGADILAGEAGKVTTAKYSSSAGNYIIINHGKDANGKLVCSVYMHCSSLCVKEGDEVTRGQLIAKVGSTGNSTGNHLHFGVTVSGSYVSPWNYIAKP